LLKYIKEFKRYVAITGFRNVKIRSTEELIRNIHKEKPQDVTVQFFDARFVATWQHLYFAVFNALNAFKNVSNISKSLGMEIMLYASAQRQINKALEKIGVKNETKHVAVVVIGETLQVIEFVLNMISENFKGEQDEHVLDFWDDKKNFIKMAFQISDVAIKTVMKKSDLENALVDLVIEKVALLATER